jgi:hypothetical protein
VLRQTGHHPDNALVQHADPPLTEPSDIRPSRPYTGPSGRTRTEHARVFRAGREPTEVEVFRVVNVGEHPDLREPALSGALHRLDDGEVVEVPFVYHDPGARQLALVIPDGARGRELFERARLLDSLMDEPEEEVPDYARDFAVVYGHEGLSDFAQDAQAMEVDVHELEPVDSPPGFASYYPKLAGFLPEAGFSARAETDLTPLVDGEDLWIFLQVDAGEEASFAESSSDLLVQLKTVDQLPVCVLSLVDARTRAVRRAYLNPEPSSDRPILDLLRRDFRATVVVLDETRRLLRAFRLEAPRAANAKMILERTERAPSCPEDRWARIVEVCRTSPPSIEAGGHPFVMRDEARTAGEALERLQDLEAWSSPERVEEALLVRSVPKNVFELSRRRTVIDALRFGLALSDMLVPQAVRFGLAPSSRSLVESLARRFEEIVPSASEHGLADGQIEANRMALRRLFAVHGTSTAPDLSCTMEHSG